MDCCFGCRTRFSWDWVGALRDGAVLAAVAGAVAETVVVVVVVVAAAAAGTVAGAAEVEATAPAAEVDSTEDFTGFVSPDGIGAGSTVGVTWKIRVKKLIFIDLVNNGFFY